MVKHLYKHKKLDAMKIVLSWLSVFLHWLEILIAVLVISFVVIGGIAIEVTPEINETIAVLEEIAPEEYAPAEINYCDISVWLALIIISLFIRSYLFLYF